MSFRYGKIKRGLFDKGYVSKDNHLMVNLMNQLRCLWGELLLERVSKSQKSYLTLRPHTQP